MNKRMRKIYCSHRLAVALYLYRGSKAGAGGGEAGTQRQPEPCQAFCQHPGVKMKVRLGGVSSDQLSNHQGPESPLPPHPRPHYSAAFPLQEPRADSLHP